MKTNLKTWSKPAVLSVDTMKNAAGGNNNGLAKGPLPIEYTYDGPGS